MKPDRNRMKNMSITTGRMITKAKKYIASKKTNGLTERDIPFPAAEFVVRARVNKVGYYDISIRHIEDLPGEKNLEENVTDIGRHAEWEVSEIAKACGAQIDAQKAHQSFDSRIATYLPKS